MIPGKCKKQLIQNMFNKTVICKNVKCIFIFFYGYSKKKSSLIKNENHMINFQQAQWLLFDYDCRIKFLKWYCIKNLLYYK